VQNQVQRNAIEVSFSHHDRFKSGYMLASWTSIQRQPNTASSQKEMIKRYTRYHLWKVRT